jgi:hypothetical protein
MGTTVLIVDDSKLARIVLGKAIAALQPDWTRLEAGNADEAIAVIEAQPVDVAVLDLQHARAATVWPGRRVTRALSDHADRRGDRQRPGRDHRPGSRGQRHVHPQAGHRGRHARLPLRRRAALEVGQPMTAHAILLDELERDALTELVNIGVSRAAGNLRKMVGEQVLLSVPSVEVVTREGATILIRERESGELVAVRQDFEGVFSGRALLIFPKSNSMALVHAVTAAPCRRKTRPIWKSRRWPRPATWCSTAAWRPWPTCCSSR